MIRRSVHLVVIVLGLNPVAAWAQPTPPTPPMLWPELLQTDGVKSYEAMRRLYAMPNETLRFLRDALPPATKTATDQQIADLIRQLSSEKFAERDKARSELEQLDWQAITAIRKALPLGDAESKRRLEQLIERTEGRLVGSSLRWNRAIEIVEGIGTKEAKSLLERWRQGESACLLTQESIRVLKHWVDRGSLPDPGKRATIDAQGDSLPAGAVLRLGSTRWRIGYNTAISSFYTSDGQRLITMAGNVRAIVNVADGKILVRHETAQSGGWVAHSSCLTRDRKRVVAAGYSYANRIAVQTLRIFDAENLKELNDWPIDGMVLGFAEKDDVVLLSSQQGIQQFDFKAGRSLELLPFPKDCQPSIRFLQGQTAGVSSKDGKKLLIYNIYDPENVKSLDVSGQFPIGFTISTDNKILACASGSGLLLFDLDSGKPIRQITAQGGTQHQYGSPIFSPDGKALLFSTYSYEDGKSELIAWDMDQHKLRWKVRGSGGRLAFSPDGQFIAGVAGRVCIWEAATGKEITASDQPNSVRTSEFDFSADGHSYIAVQSNVVRLWGFPSGKLIKEFSHRGVNQAKLSPDGLRLATSVFNHDLRIWDTQSGLELMRLPDKGSQQGFPRVFTFTLDSQRLCSWEADFRLLVWDVKQGRLIAEHTPRPEGFPKDFDDETKGRFDQLLKSASSFAFSPDGHHFFWQFQKLRKYDISTGKELRSYKDALGAGYHSRIKISKDCEWLIDGGYSQPVTLFNLRLGQKFGQIELDSTASAISPDGRCIAINSSREKRCIDLYETATLQPRHSIPLEYGYATKLEFSSDGRYLGAILSDGTVLFWDLRSLEL